eukprot:m.157150 g.157150  ORF g.157150 m.157150 type:complete len:998 (-) comp17576_c0_seq1:7-3000(-)
MMADQWQDAPRIKDVAHIRFPSHHVVLVGIILLTTAGGAGATPATIPTTIPTTTLTAASAAEAATACGVNATTPCGLFELCQCTPGCMFCGGVGLTSALLPAAVAAYAVDFPINTAFFSNNALTRLPADVFAPWNASLVILKLDKNRLTSVEPYAFAGLHNLELLTLMDNAITDVPATLLATSSTVLRYLSLTSNQLTRLPPALLQSLPDLESVALGNNLLTSLPAALLADNPKVSVLGLSGNRLTSAVFTQLDHLTLLSVLSLTSNRLTAISQAMLAPFPVLSQLGLAYNRITHVPADTFAAHGATLSLLSITGNQLTRIDSGTFDGLTQLTQLSLAQNQLTYIPNDAFRDLTRVNLLSLVNNKLTRLPSLHTLASVADLEVASNLITSLDPPDLFSNLGQSLKLLALAVNPITALPRGVFANLTILNTLDLAYNKLSGPVPDEFGSLPALQVLALNQNFFDGFETPTVFASLTNLSELVLSNNSFTALPEGLLSGQEKLTQLYLGGNKLQALPAVPSRYLNLLDVYGNRLSSPIEVEQSFNAYWSDHFGTFVATGDNPATCQFNGQTNKFSCACATPYLLHDDGVCRLPPSNTGHSTAALVGGVVGGIAAGGFLVVLVLAVRKRITSLGAELEERELLLQESRAEVDELKQAWTIHPADVRLERRIDAGSEGAFGEVWLGNWDGLDVAVKRLRTSWLELDPDVAKDFEREVDQLGKCGRHMNVVRFFGAGCMDGVPFLVTEFMALGSLSSFLRGSGGGFGGGGGGGVGHNAGGVGHGGAGHSQNSADHTKQGRSSALGWDVKLRLCQDVQAGMHYLHTLGRIHRDLKTANVLLSASMRAKVADFGSMKDVVFGRGGGKPLPAANGVMTMADPGMTMTVGIGTPMYMAPEVMRGDAYDAAADVWSFAVVLWEVGACVRPDLAVVAAADDDTLRGPGPFLVKLERALVRGLRLPMQPTFPPAFSTLIQRCWELVPAARPSFGEIGELLAQISIDAKV